MISSVFLRALPSFAALLFAPFAGAGEALPPPATHKVDFEKEIKPLFESACVKCHAKGKTKGGFSLENREALLKGGETEAGAVVGKSGESYLVELVAGVDPDAIMPKKGTRWTPEQVGLLRAWIDQGAVWPAGLSFAKTAPENLQPRKSVLADRTGVAALDGILDSYFQTHGTAVPAPVDDPTYARRVYLDLVGLLPTPEQLIAFTADTSADKRTQLVRRLLADQRGYADHWLTFWNDLLRNDYKGVGFIDGGRKQITGWLHRALFENKPYDRFVAELVAPTSESEGFTRGIIWRGNVNASMLPPMQAAQNVSQVFMGVNLKCASCHDSFINDWSLADAYGMAAIYSDETMELVHCDKPTGEKAAMRFLYPELGGVDPNLAKATRLQRLAELISGPQNGRLSRTIVNRLWARLLGRGLVEPLDDMEQPAWNRELLDWLAEDFVASGYDLKRTLEILCTSHAYQLPTAEAPKDGTAPFVFRGPTARRLTAEQFCDAISSLTGDWARLPASLEFDFYPGEYGRGLRMPQWIWTDEPPERGAQRSAIRAARAQLDAATKQLAEARQKASDALSGKPASLAPASAAIESASAAMTKAQDQFAAAATIAAATQQAPGERHKVLFRRKLTLPTVPRDAYATILGSQSFQVQVNGREAKSIQRDGFRNGRIAILNLQPLLVAGDNVITIDVSSHTEKSMNDAERKQYPASTNHLNAQSGIAFYLRCEMPEAKPIEVTTDEGWRVCRNPEGAWNAVAFDDGDWAAAKALPAGVAPVDEGPGLQPIIRQDFANLPVQLGSQLSAAVSTVVQGGGVRAALLAADPLQVALYRPNREVIIPARAETATTLQALELTNGATLDSRLQRAAAKAAPEVARDSKAWVNRVFQHSIARTPNEAERAVAHELLGQSPSPEAVADLLWIIANHPEFQLIY